MCKRENGLKMLTSDIDIFAMITGTTPTAEPFGYACKRSRIIIVDAIW